MKETFRVLSINPGSTSTKIAVYDNESQVFEHTLRHSNEEIEQFASIIEQYEFRKEVILSALKENGIEISDLDAVVGRGGLLKPVEGGTYAVNEAMIKDLKLGERGHHASNLGAIIAKEIAEEINVGAYIVDPVVVDEMEDLARLSGLNGFERLSRFHALNQKAVARRISEKLGKKYNETNLIVAHMGGGVTVGAHKAGKIIDVNDGLCGEGPFSPERVGGMPVDHVIKMCFGGEYTEAEIRKMMVGKGGFVSYLGTSDGREVSKLVEEGDAKAKLVYEAMAYQVAKEIAANAAVLYGKVDAIILTGGLAYDKLLVSWIKERVEFIAKVEVVPGEDEMIALTEGTLRVLRNEESAKEYK